MNHWMSHGFTATRGTGDPNALYHGFPRDEAPARGCLRQAERKLPRSQRLKAEGRGRLRNRDLVEIDLYEVIVARVLARDGSTCQLCGARRNLEAHHIRYRSRGGEDTEANLVTLCHACHASVHAGKVRIGLGARCEAQSCGRIPAGGCCISDDGHD